MVGNPPKMDPQRGSRGRGVLVLPASGRTGLAPNWPFQEAAHLAEWKMWQELWATPQAVEWERQGWTRVVARYVRCALAAEALEKDAMAEARQLEDRLGLTPKAMRLLLWTISTDEVAVKRESTVTDARKRFRAVG